MATTIYSRLLDVCLLALVSYSIISANWVMINRSILWLFLFFLSRSSSFAQLPSCTTPGIVYLHNETEIYNFDQSSPIVPGINPVLNSISCPVGSAGLAVGPNINGAGPSPTFYTTIGTNYYYFDGTTWVNTNHFTGAVPAVNIAAGGGYIYNLHGLTGNVYRYDGTTSIYLTNIAGFGGNGVYDLVADIYGNWYVLRVRTTGAGQFLRKYDSQGNLLNNWTLTGVPNRLGGGGFAILCDSIYFSTGGAPGPANYRGYIDNSTNTVTATVFTPLLGTNAIFDFASCPAGSGSGGANIDTGYYCGSGPGLPISATGTGAITWSVLSGNAVILGSGPNISVTSPSGISRILLTISGDGICSNATDTVTIIVPSALVNAGITPDTIEGCGSFPDTLHANVINTTTGVTYNYLWSPSTDIASGLTTLDPVVTPTANTNFVLTVSTPSNQGGCVWKDSVLRVVVDRSVTADYFYTIAYGCEADTVNFTNLSTAAGSYDWNFADGSTDTVTHPVHIYSSQNAFNVQLIAANETCADTTIKVINTQHPLSAGFTPDNDTICQGTLVTFTNTSTYLQQAGPAKFVWDFGDGTTDTSLNATHVFATPGVYNVMFVVTDFIACSDTAYWTIVVDSLPVMTFKVSDSSICEGRGVQFQAEYVVSGNTDLTWDFGDGNTAADQSSANHAFDTSGIFVVSLSGTYRVCPNVRFSKSIDVRPFPTLDLGPDTSMCPNGPALILGDRQNTSLPLAKWLWNTGDTTALIAIRHHGLYTAILRKEGCETSDSIEVYKDCYINIPNSFTPNGDGVNDYFLPLQFLSQGITKYSMTIYNRWGQEIFKTDRIDGRGWDGRFNGKEQPNGVYIYLIDAVLKSGQHERYQGNVTLIR